MTLQTHPCFKEPEKKTIKVWRYLDFTKYVSLLSSQSIFFSRSDLFDDPYEGSTTQANIKRRKDIYKKNNIPDETFKQMSYLLEKVRQWTYVNCWHMNEHESAAMWKLYAKTNEAVAIQSTYHKLKNCLSGKAYLGIVNYIDYESEWLPGDDTMWPFVHKRKSFEHERELRAVIQDLPVVDNVIKPGLPNPESGQIVPVHLQDLIEFVHVSPESSKWFYLLVKDVTEKYNFKFEVRQSLLAKHPVF